MDSRNLMNIICGVGVGALTYVLMNKLKQDKNDRQYKEIRKTLKKNKTHLPIEEAGYPGKDELDNADMVAEGSQFGVNYYNKVKQ